MDGIDLEVRLGECFGLLGPNGAGKITTIEICEGLTPPDEGTVELLGLNWQTGAEELRQRIGIQLQETQFPDKLTVEEVPRLFRSFYRRGITVDEAIRRAQLEEKRRSPCARGANGQILRNSYVYSYVFEIKGPTVIQPALGNPSLLNLVRKAGLEPASLLGASS